MVRVRVECRDVHDVQRRIVCCRSAQRVGELFFVRVGHRQPEEPMPLSACSERVDQWPNCVGVIADEDPGGSLAGFRAEAEAVDFSQRIS